MHFSITSSRIWPKLFDGISETLTSLKLDWPEQASDDDLNELEGLFPNLSHLTIERLSSKENVDEATCATHFVASLPRLSSLTLTGLWPSQLQDLLTALDSTFRLTQLAISLSRPAYARYSLSGGLEPVDGGDP